VRRLTTAPFPTPWSSASPADGNHPAAADQPAAHRSVGGAQ
jgi:hypothetical protein